jgi:uncharacterized protein (TIGR02147 family)
MKHDPLIEILKKDFQHKKSRNGSYSLRSYSRDLELDPSNLSKIMKYQLTVGPVLRSKIGLKLGFDHSEIQSWLRPSMQEDTDDGNYNRHGMEVFQVIAEAQHYAILEYFKLKNKSFEPAAIAEGLGLEVSVVTKALQRLLEVGLLKQGEHGLTPADESSSSILNVSTSKAHREQQCQILEAAIDAVKNVPIERRSQSSMTMAIDSAKLPEARELIKSFRRDLGRLLSTSPDLDSVYQLSISLYPVTQLKNNEEGN